MRTLTLTELLDQLRARDVRIWEEAGELRVRAPGGVLDDELRGELKRQKADVLALLVKARANTTSSIPVIDRTGGIPLSSAQRRLWFLDQIRADGPSAYNISAAFIAEGPLDVSALEGALADLIDRHEVLRTGVRNDQGEPRGFLTTDGHVTIDTGDLSHRTDADAVFRAEAVNAATAPFDLSAPPLVRCVVRRLGIDRFGCALKLHHMVADGESMPTLMRDLAEFYTARRRNRASALTPLRIQYADFAAWQNVDDDTAHASFWRRQFETSPDPLELPTDWPRPAVQSFSGDSVRLHIAPATMAGLSRAARAGNASLFMVLLASTAVLLQRWTNQDDIVIGTPARGRGHADLEDQVGCYVNTLALRCRLDRRTSFAEVVAQVRSTVTAAFEHDSYPFDRLVDQLAVRRDTGRSPLFDVMVSLAAEPGAAFTLDGVRLTSLDTSADVSQLDITFNFAPASDSGLDATIQYRTDLFTRSRMERLARHLTTLLAEVARDPSAVLADITTMPAAERTQVVSRFNDTAAPYDTTNTIAGRFTAQAARTPEAVAVIDGDRRWTYREIDARSNAIAAELQQRGVGPESRVALLVRRGERMMTAILGILKAGGAYVPIQPSDPARRIDDLLADCRPAAVLAEDEIAEWSTRPGTPIPTSLGPDNIAYIIYTSGSTGRPKGVLIEHGSVINRIEWMDRQYGLAPGDVVLQKTPYTFDVSVWELFWWAFSGAAIAFLPPDAEKDPAAIVDAIDRHRITKVHFVPSMLRAFLESVSADDIARLATLRDVFASGEALPAELARRFNETITRANGTRLHNLYGPTEATVDVSYFDCSTLGASVSVPIGAPVANTQLYVLDRDLQPAPVGVSGEIFIGGVNVGRGYLNRPDLTAERFMPDPWSHTGARLYRTGDVGRWREDGQIEYLGRNDHQVKIRGNRVELGEIEAALLGHPAVTNAAVVVRGDELIAYLSSDSTLTVSVLRAFLAERLPPYMVPTEFSVVTEWPLTSSGKLDRRALAAISGTTLGTGRAHVQPRTATELALAGVFAEVLKVATVSADDDFFERGGHSLMATRVVARARQQHGLDVSLRDLFAHPTVAGLAECADRREPFHGRPLRPVATQPHYPLSHAQQRLWLAEQRAPESAAYNVAVAFTVHGEINVVALTDAWRRLQSRHESLRTQFRVVNGEPRQEILDAPEIRIDVADGSSASFEAEAARIAAVPFDLTKAPLVRMAVRRFGPDAFGWVIVMHHIVCDGWSMPILVRELAMFYDDALASRPSSLRPLRLHYKDYASWQRELVNDDAMVPHRQFWHRMFQTAPPRVRLPIETRANSSIESPAGRVALVLDAAQTQALHSLGRSRGASLFMTLQAAVKALLYRYTGQTDITIGTVTAGRAHPDIEKQIGFYVNTLALRSHIDAGAPFASLIDRLSEQTLEAFDHQAYPFDSLVDDLNIEPDGRFPLFDVMVVLQNNETAELRLPGMTLNQVELPASGNKFDLNFHFAEARGAIELTLEFRTDRFTQDAIGRLGAAFVQLINSVVTAPHQTLDQLPLPPDAVREQTLAIASTFTAEPIEEPLAFWMSRLGVPARISFASFGQVFQELLDPSSVMGRNRYGANVCLLRLSDWERGANALVRLPEAATAFDGHETHVLPNGATVAHLNAYETEDVYQEIFVDRVYARHGITLHDGDVVFDIGANIGLFSLFATSTAKDLKIFGFEPAPATFDALSRNVSAYCPGARVFNCGIGGAEGRAPFTFYPKSSVFSSYHADAAADAASIRAVVRNVVEREGDVSASAVAMATETFMADRMEAQTVEVQIRTLSSIICEHGIDQIDLVKLDAEKSERAILSGLTDSDWARIRQIVIEVHDSDGHTLDFTTTLLRSQGFDVVAEEEARLHESGLFTVYGRRPSGAHAGAAIADRNVASFCDAARALTQRTPTVPMVVVACPERDDATSGLEGELAAGLARVPGIAFVSSAELARTYPVDQPHDRRADSLGSVPYTTELYAALATMVTRRIEALRRPSYKVIVLDADQTLWRGVVGEDGADNISLDAPRRALQEFMVAQRRTGVLLCLCSKNADEDVVRAFERHPEMPLRLDDFAARRVNWQPKSENLRSLAAQLSLGLDSFIFVDDNPLECAEVRSAAPEVFTLCLPEDVEQIDSVLRGTWAFDRPALTAEDTQRADFYTAANAREQLQTEASSLDAFIAGLELQIDIADAADSDIARAAQLTQRTNQFNTTTRRRTEPEVLALRSSGQSVAVVRVRDRFGDYGLVGVAIYGTAGASLSVDAMMLSCRALGRGVEHAMVAHLGRAAIRSGLTHVDIQFAPTPKNSPARGFLDGLSSHERLGTGDEWTYRLRSADAADTTFVPGAENIRETSSDATETPAPRLMSRSAGVEAGLCDVEQISSAVSAWAESRTGAPRRSRRASIVPPRTATERSLAAIWTAVLGVADIGINENFFDLGGHSLKAIRMLSRAAEVIGADLTLGDLFAHPTIGGLAAHAAISDRSTIASIPPAPSAANYPLSGAQRRLWILSEMGGDGTVAYNVPAAFVLTGDVNISALESAFRRLIARHESLRTRFIVVDGEPRQEIVAEPDFVLGRVGSGPLTEGEFVAAATALAHEPIPFDRAPFLRASITQIDTNRWGLAIVIHHVVTDAWSMPILMRELLSFYNDARRDVPTTIEPLRIHYKDYAVWQNDLLASPAAAEDQQFWRAVFSETPVAIDVPADAPRPPVQSFQGESLARHLGAPLSAQLRDISARHGATLFMTLVAALDVLLYRYTGDTDITVGSPVTGRVHRDLEDQVGFYVNTLALRTRLLPGETFSALLGRVRDDVGTAFRHQLYPFDRLVEELQLPRDLGRSPLFDVMLVVEHEAPARLALPGVDVRPIAVGHDVSRFDMTFHVAATDTGLELGVQYNTALFRRERVEAMAAHFESLLTSIVRDASQPIADIALNSADERQKLTVGWARGASIALPDQSLVDRFRAQVQQTPESPALIDADGAVLTYRQLDERSDALARHLASLGLLPEQVVGVQGQRSAFTFATMLGIMKCGGTYLPLDPALPRARVDFMIADSSAAIVLTPASAITGAAEPKAPDAETLAYVIYTSGSTGLPKGVGVTHNALLNMALDQIRAFGLKAGDVLGQFSAVSFDASIYEAFLALLSGAALTIVPDEARMDPRTFIEWAERVRPTVMVLPPAFVRTLDRANLSSVRLLVTAGEAADIDDARHYAASLRYVNAYGPTEFAVCATTFDVTSAHDGPVPIGRPISNASTYVLDERGEPSPIGVPGELYLGGRGLARGYVNQASLTAERFVPDPFSAEPGARLYRTGDLARWRQDGTLEFLGRNDFQVKVRGHRIELGEIENVLRSHVAIRDAVVIARALDLVAYVVGEDVGADALKMLVRQRLPEYMVPAHVIHLERLPLTPSGKVNRAALPAPAAQRSTVPASDEQPATAAERAIADIWCSVLGVSHVGTRDSFFDLGGNSILLARVLSALRKDIKPDLTLLDLFTYPRIQDLASHISSEAGAVDANAATRVASRADKQRAALTQARRPKR